MRKYNLSEIMKDAWNRKKCNANKTFSECLKTAWAMAKKKAKKMEEASEGYSLIEEVKKIKLEMTVKYAFYKNEIEGKLHYGIDCKKGNYNSSTKEIDLTLSFNDDFMCEDFRKIRKYNVNSLKRVLNTSKENFCFYNEAEEKMRKNDHDFFCLSAKYYDRYMFD